MVNLLFDDGAISGHKAEVELCYERAPAGVGASCPPGEFRSASNSPRANRFTGSNDPISPSISLPLG